MINIGKSDAIQKLPKTERINVIPLHFKVELFHEGVFMSFDDKKGSMAQTYGQRLYTFCKLNHTVFSLKSFSHPSTETSLTSTVPILKLSQKLS